MKTPRQSALEILLRVEREKSRLAPLLESATQFDRRDRAFISALVYGVTRWRLCLDTIIQSACKRPVGKVDLETLVILRLGLYQALGMTGQPAYSAVNEAVNLAKTRARTAHTAGFVNAVARGVLRNIDHESSPGRRLPEIAKSIQPPGAPPERALGEAYSFPRWITRRWISRFGVTTAERILERSNRRAPAFFRVNRLVADPARALEVLESEGIEAERTQWMENVYKVTSGVLLPSSPAVKLGMVQPQDAASAMAASLLRLEPGLVVADVCCGKGIKTGMLAQMMDNDGCIACFDASLSQMRLLMGNMKRLKVTISTPVIADMTRAWPVNRKFDRIFLDAPCSGTGVLRRHPEGKWNKTESVVAQMADVQRQILEHALERLAPGGQMVYCVCSIEPEEGEAQVDRALDQCRKLALDNIGVGRPELDEFMTGRGELFVEPGAGGMDGFYSARLVMS